MNLYETLKLQKLMTTFEKDCFTKAMNRRLNDRLPHYKADRCFEITYQEATETLDRIIKDVTNRNPNWRETLNV